MTQTIKIATRSSPLALWQAEHVAARLTAIHTDLVVKLVKITTKADRFLNTTLDKIGGKGLFVKELEESLLSGETDLAVHSMKDVPMTFPAGLALTTILQRANPHDAFVSIDYQHPDQLPANSRLGTSSLRRKAQLAKHYPHLELVDLRGNVNTRLQKLQNGEFAAIILAMAGLERLQMTDHVQHTFTATEMLPAIGQGAIGIETRVDDQRVQNLLAPLADTITTQCVLAERAMNNQLHGGCHMPVAGFATSKAYQLHLTGYVGTVNGQTSLQASAQGHTPEQVGQAVAQQLIEQGAQAILDQYRS